MPQHRRILIIDRDRANRLETASCLAAMGYRVCEAESRADGLRIMYQAHPHLILLGLALPSEEAWETLSNSGMLR